MLYFHDLMLSFPGVISKISYRIPFYYRKSWLCYLNPTKEEGVEFAFPRGNELSNSQGLLESKSRNQVTSVTFQNIKEIPEATIREIIHEAILLDDAVPYSGPYFKRKTKKQE